MSELELIKVLKTSIEYAAFSIAVKLFILWFVAAMAVAVVNQLVGRYTDIGRDDTDPPAGRSDMKIMTDHATGCQYLMSSRGGLTPRLDENGKQMCTKGTP